MSKAAFYFSQPIAVDPAVGGRRVTPPSARESISEGGGNKSNSSLSSYVASWRLLDMDFLLSWSIVAALGSILEGKCTGGPPHWLTADSMVRIRRICPHTFGCGSLQLSPLAAAPGLCCLLLLALSRAAATCMLLLLLLLLRACNESHSRPRVRSAWYM